MSPTEIALVGARFLNLTGLSLAFGALAFALWVHPGPKRLGEHKGAPLRLLAFGCALSLLGAAFWAPAQAGAMAGAQDAQAVMSALPVLVTRTGFGHALMARTGLVLLVLLLLRPARRHPLALAALLGLLGLALVLQTRLGHAAAEPTLFVPAALALHILGASLWLGALVALALLLWQAPADGLAAARRFAWLGLAGVSALLLGGVLAALPLVGDLGGLLDTPYGLLVLAKLALAALMLVLAATNRVLVFRASPRALRRSVATETGAALLAALAAALLATLPPARHAEPLWSDSPPVETPIRAA